MIRSQAPLLRGFGIYVPNLILEARRRFNDYTGVGLRRLVNANDSLRYSLVPRESVPYCVVSTTGTKVGVVDEIEFIDLIPLTWWLTAEPQNDRYVLRDVSCQSVREKRYAH